MKNNSVLTTCFALFGLCTCVVCGVGFYAYNQFGRVSPPGPPNVFRIDHGIVGQILIASPRSKTTPSLGIQEIALNTEFEVLPTAFSAGSGRWIAIQGSATYQDLNPDGKPASQKGIWTIGTLTAPELQDYQVFELYIGTAGDAVKAGSAYEVKKVTQKVAQKLIANGYIKAP